MLTQVDYELLLERIKKLEERVKVCEAYIDTQLKEKYHPFNFSNVLNQTQEYSMGYGTCYTIEMPRSMYDNPKIVSEYKSILDKIIGGKQSGIVLSSGMTIYPNDSGVNMIILKENK